MFHILLIQKLIFCIYYLTKWPHIPIQLAPTPNNNNKKHKDSNKYTDIFQQHFNQEILCKMSLYIAANGKIQLIYQSGKTDYIIVCSTESSET